jgi:LPS-assembly protein
MMMGASHPHLMAQQVTTQAPPPQGLPNAPETVLYPTAEVLPEPDDTTPVTIESDGPQSKTGSLYVLDKNVVITYKDRVIRADHIEYDSDTGELVATGHLNVTGGTNHEDISASHGTMNVEKQTGRFYDVTGSVGVKTIGNRTTYTGTDPFLFTGRMVVKTGPREYEIYDGTVTSCQLPDPDWMLGAGKFYVGSEKASARNSVFHVLNIPLLYLPYVTHPVDGESRQSGLLIPELVTNSSTKGFVLGEDFYWAINRSTDLTVGVEYYSLRGWSQKATFRYRGLGHDFATARYSGLLDRGIVTGGVYVNQGGEDVTFLGRHDFSSETRVAADVEYLSAYVYREAFTENFNQAVSTDILSVAYGVHQWNGYEAGLRADRYQGLKQVAVPVTATTPAIPEEQVRIFHAPSLDLSSTEHALGATGFLWSVESSVAGLKRVQPAFATSGITERIDLHPELAYPLFVGGWHLRPSIGVRETGYSRSREAGAPGLLPIESGHGLNRADFEAEIEMRAPVVERTFDSPGVEKMFGHDLRHTIEPSFTYRYVTGVNNFLQVLRFDDVDVMSNTNELEYGVTQRLFLRPLKQGACSDKDTGPTPEAQQRIDLDRQQIHSAQTKEDKCGNREWISWRLTQKYFFNENFGGAVINGRRNIFDTTLNLSGIAFLTEPRNISPLVSRLRVRTSPNFDFEWDFDLDTGAKKFTSNNVLLDAHKGNIFGGMSYARLNAPGRFYTEGLSSSVSNFSQLRLLLGYGSPTKPGFGIAANAGLDLIHTNGGLVQYGAVQTSYNWDCCGFSVEYRKYELGSVRNEGVERFSFTLKNIGSAGNLKRAESLF